MGFIASILDPDSLEYNPDLANVILKDLEPTTTVVDLFKRIDKVKEQYESNL